MKKFFSYILLIYMSLSVSKTFAQSTDSLRVVVDRLSVQVTKLEHDLNYLKINTDINKLDANIELFSIKVERILTDYQIAVLSNNKEESRRQLQELHKAYEESMKSIKDAVDVLAELVNSNEDSFSPFENLNLTIRVIGIRSSYYSLENKMSIIRDALDK